MAIRTLSKALAGIKDIQWGRGVVSQTRNGTAYNITRIAKIHPVDLLVDIKAIVTTDANEQYFEVQLKGTTSINDGNGGDFYFEAASTATPDDLAVILPDDINIANPGRWLKLIDSGVQRTGDTMSGQLKGITPVAANDLSRKDYVDAHFKLHYDGLDADGTGVTFSGDLNTITVSSRYVCDPSVVSNGPTVPAGVDSTPMVVETAIVNAFLGSSERHQVALVVLASSTNSSALRFFRTYHAADASWTAWIQGVDTAIQVETSLYITDYLAVVPSIGSVEVKSAGDSTDIDLLLSSGGTNSDVAITTQGTGEFKKNTLPVYSMVVLDTPIQCATNTSFQAWVSVDVSVDAPAVFAANPKKIIVALQCIASSAGDTSIEISGSIAKGGVTPAYNLTRICSDSVFSPSSIAMSATACGEGVVSVDSNGDFDVYLRAAGGSTFQTIPYIIGYYV